MEPKVRFKGFEGKWIEASLSNLSSNFKYGINAPAVSFDGENKYLRITDIDDTMHSFLQNNVTSPGTDLSCCDEYLMQDGDIVIARTGASVGKSYIYHPFDGKVYFAGFLIRMRLNENTNRDFVFQNTLTNAYAKHVQFVSQRSGQPGINVNELQAYKLRIPSLSEQQNIATYFLTLDSKIQTTSKKLASLKKLKSASLVAMFPQNGESMPKVRFKGFEGEWKIKSFKELYKRSSIKNDLTYDSSKIISVANMYFKEDNMNTDETYLLTYNVMKLGDIAFEGNKSKSFAHGRFVENSIGNGIVSHVFVVFSPLNENYDIDFWKYYINNEQVMGSKLVRCTKSSTMMTDLVVDDFLKETILVPSLEEQQELGRYFATLDRKIALETARLEKLKQIKLACLDKMFV